MGRKKRKSTGAALMRKELKKLLRRLSQKGARLERAGECGGPEQGRQGEGACYMIVIEQQGFAIRRQPFANGALVDYCLKQDLFERRGDGWILGANGKMAAKRLLAGADPFAAQHQQRSQHSRIIDDQRQSVQVNDSASPLAWLARRKGTDGKPMIDGTQLAAGERLARDFHYAGLQARTTSSWSALSFGAGGRRSAPGMGVEMSDNRLAALQRVRTALNEVGVGLGDILLDICCFQQGLVEVEKARGWPRRSGKVILQIALDHLVDHYGMGKQAQTSDFGPRISHWGAENYRPQIDNSSN